jgi:hypothetical protein
MIRLKGNSTYIKNVKAPTMLVMQVISGFQNNTNVRYPDRFCKLNSVVTLDLSPANYINKSGNIVTDMNDYAYNVLNDFIQGCYNTNNIDILKSEISQLGATTIADAAYDIGTDLRASLDKEPLLDLVRTASNFFNTDGIFSAVIGNITFDFEHKFLDNLFNDKLDQFNAVFRVGNLYHGTRYNTDSANRNKYTLSDNKHLSFRDFYDLLVEIFFFYAFQSRRNELIAGKLFDLYACSNTRSARGEIYVWDNNLEQYMSYIPRKENKWVIGDLCIDINVDHNMSEGLNDLYDEFRTDGGEKFNPIERKKISLIGDVVGNSNELTFVTMPPKRLHYYKGDVMLNSYNAYRSFANNNGVNEAVGITLYTTHKIPLKSSAINKIIYSDRIRDLMLSNFNIINLINYDDLLFSSMQYDLSNPDIDFKCRVAYFTRGGGRTLKDEESLKTAKIPKEKRDQVFKALCDLCYELDVEPQDVIDRLDVDFKRLYKKPTELL